MRKNTVGILVASVLSMIGGVIAGIIYGRETEVKEICDAAEDQGEFTVVYQRLGEPKQKLSIQHLGAEDE